MEGTEPHLEKKEDKIRRVQTKKGQRRVTPLESELRRVKEESHPE